MIYGGLTIFGVPCWVLIMTESYSCSGHTSRYTIYIYICTYVYTHMYSRVDVDVYTHAIRWGINIVKVALLIHL